MPVYEKILVIIFLFGAFLRKIGIVGNSLFIVVSLLGLAIFYFCFSFFLFNKIEFNKIFSKGTYYKVPALNIVYSIIAGIGLSTLVVGIMYDIMHYNGSKMYVTAGLVIYCISIILLLVIRKNFSRIIFNYQIKRFVFTIGIGIITIIIL